MFGFSWQQYVVIAVVAIVAVGLYVAVSKKVSALPQIV
jgi:hypothetical protein